MFLSIERLAIVLFACAVTLIAATMAFARSVDPLSKGPLPITEGDIRNVRAAYEHRLIYKDEECFLSTDQMQRTEVPTSQLPVDACKSRTNELVYLGKSNTLVACLNESAEWAMNVVIGSNGLGKTREGNRKSPSGTYWLGVPRHSPQFGLFIPVGYPNLANIALGRTGSAIGIHGPMRGLHCHPEFSLARNWTAGCIAVGRDSQTIAISEWILAHWPAKITLTVN